MDDEGGDWYRNEIFDFVQSNANNRHSTHRIEFSKKQIICMGTRENHLRQMRLRFYRL
jgi:hypothetical protein